MLESESDRRSSGVMAVTSRQAMREDGSGSKCIIYKLRDCRRGGGWNRAGAECARGQALIVPRGYETRCGDAADDTAAANSSTAAVGPNGSTV